MERRILWEKVTGGLVRAKIMSEKEEDVSLVSRLRGLMIEMMEHTNSIVQARQEIANCENRIHLFASKAEECHRKINKILEKFEEMEKNSGNTAERPIRNIVLGD